MATVQPLVFRPACRIYTGSMPLRRSAEMVCETSMAVPPSLSTRSCAISSAEAHAYAEDDQRCLVKRLSASRLGVEGEQKTRLQRTEPQHTLRGRLT